MDKNFKMFYDRGLAKGKFIGSISGMLAGTGGILLGTGHPQIGIPLIITWIVFSLCIRV
jgi:hypothetical protein